MITKKWAGILSIVCVILVAGCAGLTGTNRNQTSGDIGQNQTVTEGGDLSSNSPEDIHSIPVQSLIGENGLNNTKMMRINGKKISIAGSYYMKFNKSFSTDQGTIIDQRNYSSSLISMKAHSQYARFIHNGSTRLIRQYERFLPNEDIYYKKWGESWDSDYSKGNENFTVSHRYFNLNSQNARLFFVHKFEFERNITRNDMTLYRFKSDSFRDPSNTSRSPPNSFTSPNSTLLISENGIIRFARFSYDVDSSGDSQTENFDATLKTSNIGDVSVEEPSWVDEARSQTSG